MKKNVSVQAMVIFTLLLLFTACKKEHSVSPTVTPNQFLKVPKAPIAHAGNDTTIYLPFNSYNLTGIASKDPDSNIVSYKWRLFAGPSPVDKIIANTINVFVSGLLTVGNYEFELTVTDADNLFSKDTIKITIAEPNCTNLNNEVIIKDLPWDYSWIMEIDIYNIFSYLPPNSYLKNIYIKRDSSSIWEKVVPMNWNSPDYGRDHEWEYWDGVLVIYPGINSVDDTPDVKIEYCN